MHAFVYYKPGLWGFHHIACHNNMTLHTHTIYVLLYIYVCVYVVIYIIYIPILHGGGMKVCVADDYMSESVIDCNLSMWKHLYNDLIICGL